MGRTTKDVLLSLSGVPKVPSRTPPCHVSHGAVLHSLRQSGQWTRSVHLLARMLSRDVRPDAVSYCSVFMVCEFAHAAEQLAALMPGLQHSAASFDVDDQWVASQIEEWLLTVSLLQVHQALGVSSDRVFHRGVLAPTFQALRVSSGNVALDLERVLFLSCGARHLAELSFGCEKQRLSV